MRRMFEGNSNLLSLDLTHFVTSNALHMDDMFVGLTSINELRLGNWELGAIAGGDSDDIFDAEFTPDSAGANPQLYCSNDDGSGGIGVVTSFGVYNCGGSD